MPTDVLLACMLGPRKAEERLGSPRNGVLVVVSYCVGAREQLRSSRRAIRALNHRTISPAPLHCIFKLTLKITLPTFCSGFTVTFISESYDSDFIRGQIIIISKERQHGSNRKIVNIDQRAGREEAIPEKLFY